MSQPLTVIDLWQIKNELAGLSEAARSEVLTSIRNYLQIAILASQSILEDVANQAVYRHARVILRNAWSTNEQISELFQLEKR
jgi:hypothetical protein